MSLRNRQTHALIKSGWIRAVLLFIIYLSAAVLTGWVIGLYAIGKAVTENDVPAPWIIFSSLFSIILVFLFRKFVDRRSFNSIGLSLSQFYPGGVIGLLAGLFLVSTGGLVIYLMGGLQWTDVLYSNDVFLSIGLLLLVAFSEELVFRGYMLRNLLKSFNQWLSLAISAFLFALVHLMNPGIPVVGIVNIILGGLVLGITYMNTRNLWMPVLFHFSWNFFQGPVLGFPVSGLSFKSILSATLSGNDLLTGGSFGFEGSIICTVLLLITFLTFVLSGRLKTTDPA